MCTSAFQKQHLPSQKFRVGAGPQYYFMGQFFFVKLPKQTNKGHDAQSNNKVGPVDVEMATCVRWRRCFTFRKILIGLHYW